MPDKHLTIKINGMLVRERKQFFTYKGVLSYPCLRIFLLEPQTATCFVEQKGTYLFGRKRKRCIMQELDSRNSQIRIFPICALRIFRKTKQLYFCHTARLRCTCNKHVLLGGTVISPVVETVTVF